MPLTCECDSEDYEVWFFRPNDYTVLAAKRGRRCTSCKCIIHAGDTCTEFKIERYPRSAIEERIHGDAVPIASKYMCEMCSDLYFSFIELGYCVGPDENMETLLTEYKSL